MLGEYVFVDPSMFSDSKVDPLSQGRIFFLKNDYKKMIDVLLKMIHDLDYPIEYRNACITNLAMAFHVMGYYEKAKEFYDMCDNTILKTINFYAFCHRYFEYKNIYDKDYVGPLDYIYDHNRLNYFLNAFGANAAIDFWGNRPVNIYDEQIFNEIRKRRGEVINPSCALYYEKEYIKHCKYIDRNDTSSHSKENRIGIFVTDLQRHKDSAMLYHLLDELLNEYIIIIYYNNIFQNKLIRSIENRVILRDISNMEYGAVINIIQNDSISLLIDTAEYGVRNKDIAIANCGIMRISLSDILDQYPIILKSNEYFPKIENSMVRNSVLVLGDLRYVSDSDLEKIKERCNDRQIVFETHALDEPVFAESFMEKLMKHGFTMNKIHLKKGVLPFAKYMEYISSFEKILLIQGATHVEISEVIKSGVAYEMLTTYNEKKTRPQSKQNFLKKIKEIIKKNEHMTQIKREIIKDQIMCFLENERYYCVNCTCNGDLLVFDDVKENRNEYFNVI